MRTVFKALAAAAVGVPLALPIAAGTFAPGDTRPHVIVGNVQLLSAGAAGAPPPGAGAGQAEHHAGERFSGTVAFSTTAAAALAGLGRLHPGAHSPRTFTPHRSGARGCPIIDVLHPLPADDRYRRR